MRVRLNRNPTSHQRSTPPGQPRLRLVAREAEEAREADEFAEERRMRDAGGPRDTSTYACGCGMVFEAAVTTSVSCPHCGAGQAW